MVPVHRPDPGRVVPTATYRLQVTRDFPLAAVRARVPYLHDLGVDWVYLSPILTAARWESFLMENRGTTRSSGWRMVVLSHGGVFLFTQLTALFVGVAGSFGALRPSLEPAFVVPATLAGLDVVGRACGVS